MRREPIELALADGAKTSARRHGGAWPGERRRVTVAAGHGAPATILIDEAFAHYETQATTPPRPAAVEDAYRVERTLADQLAAQLEILDRQREHLAQLLRNIDGDSASA